jgi:ubiquinol-cytochrome c reductase cytochrome b subunit
MSDWHAAYRARYAQLKKEGVPFFPDVVFKDMVTALVVFAALAGLAWFAGAGLEDLADPTDATYNPRPEWYFLFMFQALKFFPGDLEAVAAVILPGLVVLWMVLLPFADRGPRRHPLDRPLMTGICLMGLVAIGWLTWQGYRSPLVNPVVEKDPQVEAGRRLFLDLRCLYCHRVAGKGGAVGPDLTKVEGEKASAWVAKHIRNPQAADPGSQMPKMDLLDDEITALSAYVKSLGAGLAYSPEAVGLFAAHCGSCHRVRGQGGDAGPDLSLIGSARDVAYIKRYINDPSKTNQSSSMPGFAGQLTDTQIEDLSRYLSAQGR